MAETRFTPGPWKWSYRDELLTHDDREVMPMWVEGQDPTLVEGCAVAFELSSADAHLIAAAPEMYAALAELAGRVEAWEAERIRLSGTEKRTDLTAARAALAKARGESP